MIKPSYICFDIETEPYDRPTIVAEADSFPADAVKLGPRKNPEVIEQYIQAQRIAYYDRLVEEAALHAITGTVLVIGIYDSDEDGYMILEGKEPAILSSFWEYLQKMRGNFTRGTLSKFVGFNILGFDLPFLCRRSWKNSIKVPDWVFDGRYFDRQFVDLLTFWRCGNRQEHISLDRLARFVELKGKERTGKGFHEFYHAEHDKAIDYVKADLLLCAKIALKIHV